MAQVAAVVAGKGFVQGIVMYTVMDDLTVTPMSSISSMTLLNTSGVRDFAALQEKTVRLGSSEVSIPNFRHHRPDLFRSQMKYA